MSPIYEGQKREPSHVSHTTSLGLNHHNFYCSTGNFFSGELHVKATRYPEKKIFLVFIYCPNKIQKY